MATPLPAHSIIQVRFVGSLFGQQVMNVFYYLWKSGTAGDDYRTIMGDILDSLTGVNELYDKWRQTVSESVTSINLIAQPVYPTRLSGVRRVAPLPTGAVVGTDMPANVAATITKSSDIAARYGRGSTHVPGMVIEHIDADSNLWAAAYQAALGELGDKIAKTYTLDDFTDLAPVLWNLTNPLRTVDITGRIVQDTPRVERRRTLRLGK